MTGDNLTECLQAIISKTGPYKRDPLEHAENVMDNSRENALKARKLLIETFTLIAQEAAENKPLLVQTLLNIKRYAQTTIKELEAIQIQ